MRGFAYRRVFFVLAALCLPLASFAQSSSPDFEAMLREVDRIGDFSGFDFSGLFTIASEKPGQKLSVSQARIFRRDSKKQYLILVQLPEAERGQGYLKEGNNVWFYDPVSRKFDHRSNKEDLSGSDARNSDFSNRSLLDDYSIAATEEGMIQKFPVWIITLKARRPDVDYDSLRLSIRKDRVFLLKLEELGASGRVMRTTYYPKYAEVAKDKFFPSSMLIVDNINVGEKSQVTMSELSIEKLPDKVFTKAFLEQVN